MWGDEMLNTIVTLVILLLVVASAAAFFALIFLGLFLDDF